MRSSIRSAFLALSSLLVLVVPTLPATESEQPGHEDLLLAGTRQLIFEGRRSGEGYFSADGSRLIFQSERLADNPFYQIYLMDLGTGDTRRISPGIGKTTCAWIHPDGDKVLFASTHEDLQAIQKQQDELAKRAAGKGSRYSWSFDEHFEIYEADTAGNILRRLTDAPGYDAEGSWSPDGQSIAFASNRHAYLGGLTEEEQKVFRNDQSVFMEIYRMDADGGNVRRLTDSPGYDGGPFFSADGSRIVWRRFDDKGVTAEIWTMRPDGSDQRQITRLGVMSWAPYFHPSGDYIVFANNAHGFGNFELYIVDARGEKEPVRVTQSEGFDGLPVFSPDGRRLSWASSRTPDGKAQIFVADWDDAQARKLLGLAAAGSAPAPVDSREETGQPHTSPGISAEDLRLHVSRLASEPMAGRMTGTEGARLATAYVADVMAEIGLGPAGDMGGWYQRYGFTAGVELAEGNRLTLHSDGGVTDLQLDQDWRPLSFSGTGAVEQAGLVFAGYGLLAPAEGDYPAYDSYQDLDVLDEWVLVLRYLPEDLAPERRQHLHEYADLRFKAMVARDKGARGLILVTGPSAQVKDQLVPLTSEAGAGGGSLPVVSVTDEVGQKLLATAGRDLAEVQRSLDDGEPLAGFELPGVGVGVGADIRLVKRPGEDRNVLGRLNAGEGPGDSLVVIGAHVDHIGLGEDMDSRDTEPEAGKVHPGADDNASGVAALLEIAQDLAHQRATGQLDLKQDILFAVWTGEELGRLGSARFADAFLAGDLHSGLTPRVTAYLNLDMVGRLDRQLYVQAVGSSTRWKGELERRNAPIGLPLRLQDDSYLPTDTTSFYLKGIPVLTFFTGTHADYNTPRDTAERLNYGGLVEIARLVGLITRGLAASEEALDYVDQDKPKTDASRANLRAYLGTIPDYTETDVAGVLVNGVAKGGPAEQGGIQAGDLIVSVAGRAVENIYDYTYALNALKVGQPVTLRVRRGDAEIELEVTPGARE